MEKVSFIDRKNPEVVLRNRTDMAKFIYGDSLCILRKKEADLTAQELRILAFQITENKDLEMFGVRLVPVVDLKQVHVGSKLLRIRADGFKSGYLVEALRKSHKHGTMINASKFFPKYHTNLQRSFPLSRLFIQDEDMKLLKCGIYFHYSECPSKQDLSRKRPLSFGEIVRQKAEQFFALGECWVSLFAPASMSDGFMESTHALFDRFQNKPDHLMLAMILQQVLASNDLRGINRFYNLRDPNLKIDKITPLLRQMQWDVLSRLCHNLSLAERVFPYPKDEGCWERRYHALMANYDCGSELNGELNYSAEKCPNNSVYPFPVSKMFPVLNPELAARRDGYIAGLKEKYRSLLLVYSENRKL